MLVGAGTAERHDYLASLLEDLGLPKDQKAMCIDSGQAGSEMEPLLASDSSGAATAAAHEQRASSAQGMFFGGVNPLMRMGVQRQLHVDDLLELSASSHPTQCTDALWEAWREAASEGSETRRALLRAMWQLHWREYTAIGCIKLVGDALNFVGPFLLQLLLRELQRPAETNWVGHLSMGWWSAGYTYASLLGLSAFIKGVLNGQYNYRKGRITCQLRSSITCMLLRKAFLVPAYAKADSGTADVQTLMSVDADRVVNIVDSAHELWSLPLQILVALCLLYIQVQLAFAAGLAVVLLLIPINRWLAQKIGSSSQSMMASKDARLGILQETLANMRQIKMAALEAVFADKIDAARSSELHFLGIKKFVDAGCVASWAVTSLLFTTAVFSAYSLSGHALTAPVVFTSLALLNILIAPLNSLPWVINGIVEAVVSLDRLQVFLAVQQGDRNVKAPVTELADGGVAAVSLREASFSWHSRRQNAAPSPMPVDRAAADTVVLQNLTFDIAPGALVVVTGPSGCGTSSLLSALLGELRLLSGSCQLAGDAAFVPQQAWLTNGSIRSNILLGQEVDQQRYQAALAACGLDADIAHMAAGDLTGCGSRGSALSGGQCARIALARALCQGADRSVWLCDNIFAAVDVHSAALLLRTLRGPLLAGKTRVVATNHPPCIQVADMVVTLENGSILHIDRKTPAPAEQQHKQRTEEHGPACNRAEPQPVVAQQQHAPHIRSASLAAEGPLQLPQGDGSEAEARAVGRVTLAVYGFYLAGVGTVMCAIVMSSLLLMQATRTGSDLWLSWAAAHPRKSTGSVTSAAVSTSLFLRGLLAFAAANVSCAMVRAFSFAYAGLTAAKQLHVQLLTAVIYRPCTFFEQTPSGRILNRFSSDQATADDSLPFMLNILLATGFALLAVALLLCATQPLLLLFAAPLVLLHRRISSVYSATARELRRLQSVARSPVYAHFAEALDGVISIRAFGLQQAFCRAQEQHVAVLQRATITGVVAAQWLAVRLQTIAAVVVALVALLSAAKSNGLLPGPSRHATTNISLIGLCLTYALPITSLLNGILTSATETEQEFVAVERIMDYAKLSAEDAAVEGAAGRPAVAPAASAWPSRGAISFEGVSLRYAPHAAWALHEVSLEVQPGELLGICGRTGSGKSTLLAALLRLYEISDGNISIDGSDIRTLPLTALRTAVCVVPQQPLVFEGSVAENVDPLGRYSDAAIIAALKAVHLWPVIQGLVNQADAADTMPPGSHVVTVHAGSLHEPLLADDSAADAEAEPSASTLEGSHLLKLQLGNRLSQGRRQLLALARAVLRRARIVCLDEVTAHLGDAAGDTVLDLLRGEALADATVLLVAHKLQSIVRCDRVAVMAGGRLVEAGTPEELLSRPEALFSGMCRAGKIE